MRNSITFLAVALAVAALPACSIMKVHSSAQPNLGGGKWETNRAPGIPFYVKTRVYGQETTYVLTDHRVTLTIKNGDSPSVAETVTFRGAGFDKALKKLREALEDPALNGLDQAWTDFKVAAAGSSRRDLRTTYEAPTLVRNRLTETMKVDTSTTYFLNGNHPFAGTGSLNVTLNSDGTLNKVEGSVTDETFGKVLDALPVGSAVSSFLGLGDGQTEKIDAAKDATEVQLEITPTTRSLVISNPLTSPSLPDPIDFADHRSHTFEIRSAQAAPPKKKSEGKKVSFDGSIVLPK